MLKFLDVNKHDVVAVAGKLAKWVDTHSAIPAAGCVPRLTVVSPLSRHFRIHGESLLREGKPFNLTPNQCYCAARRRLLPLTAKVWLSLALQLVFFSFLFLLLPKVPTSTIVPFQVPESRMTEDASAYGSPEDIPFLYEFMQHVRHVRIHPKQRRLVGSGDGRWPFFFGPCPFSSDNPQSPKPCPPIPPHHPSGACGERCG